MKEEKSEEVQELLEYGEKTAGPAHVARLPRRPRVRHGGPGHRAGPQVAGGRDRLRPSTWWTTTTTWSAASPGAAWSPPTRPPRCRFLRQEEPVSVTADTDQEEVARLVAKYDLVAVPVVERRPSPAGRHHGRRRHRRHPGGGHRGHPAARRRGRRRDRPRPGPGRLPQAPGLAADQPRRPPSWPPRSSASSRARSGSWPCWPSSCRSWPRWAGIGTTQTATVVVRGLALGDMTAAHLWRVLRKESHPGRDHRAGQRPGHGRDRLPLEGAGPAGRHHRASP